MSTNQTAPSFTDEYRTVFADILSQAITGELIGMANYARWFGCFGMRRNNATPLPTLRTNWDTPKRSDAWLTISGSRRS